MAWFYMTKASQLSLNLTEAESLVDAAQHRLAVAAQHDSVK
jgi:hypothetical protein